MPSAVTAFAANTPVPLGLSLQENTPQPFEYLFLPFQNGAISAIEKRFIGMINLQHANIPYRNRWIQTFRNRIAVVCV